MRNKTRRKEIPWAILKNTTIFRALIFEIGLEKCSEINKVDNCVKINKLQALPFNNIECMEF